MRHALLLARHGGGPSTRASALNAALRCLCTLAIETSCDDTCVAIIDKRRADEGQEGLNSEVPMARLLFNEKITLDSTANKGIHPMKAVASHQANLAKLVARSLESLGSLHSGQGSRDRAHHSPLAKIDFISVTRGPGMRSNLSCGLDTAKGLAVALGIPLVGVHHMHAHALTPRLSSALSPLNSNGRAELVPPCGPHEQTNGTGSTIDQLRSPDVEPKFPFLTLLVSGGHTLLVHSKALTEHMVLATTGDIAIGDALDKIGRVILPKDIIDNAKDVAFAKHLSEYAFPHQEKYSEYPVAKKRGDEAQKSPNKYGWHVQTPLVGTRQLAFSFSGLASRIESLWAERTSKGHISDDERRLFAQTALGTAFEHLASRTAIALSDMRHEGIEMPTLVVSGGVAANPFLRIFLRRFLNARQFDNVNLVFPPPALCTDNAAMIAWAGIEMFEAGFRSDLSCTPLRRWTMSSHGPDGGVTGVGELGSMNSTQGVKTIDDEGDKDDEFSEGTLAKS